MRISKRLLKNKKGLTLIEIMIVIVLIAILFTAGASRISKNFGSPIKKATRYIVLLTRQLHSQARLKNRTYRIVIEFPNREANTRSKLYVESASADQLMEPDLYSKYKKRSSFQDAPPSPFAPDTQIMKKPFYLPDGVEFQSVEVEAADRPLTEGKAYIHFFSQGLIEKTVILLGDGQKREISLIINPLTGRTDVENSKISLRDIDK